MMIEKKTEPDNQTTQQDKPPIFSSWKNMYIFVFGQLIVLIIFLT
jgi:hypothetical protein